MSKCGTVIDRCGAAAQTRGKALTGAADPEERRLRALAELHAISVTMLPNACVSDVEKCRTVTVTYFVGQHASGAQYSEGCPLSARIRPAIEDLATFCIPIEQHCCQHLSGATRSEANFSGTAHRVSLPVVFYSPDCFADR